MAEALSAPFPFVRVDLYDGDDGIYFGELTFTPPPRWASPLSRRGSSAERDPPYL
ncbi:hypothetical protein GCM10020258_39990 [Sphingomonas yabuuchiae]